MTETTMNPVLVLIQGTAAAGKSVCTTHIDPKTVAYLSTEGKCSPLPYKRYGFYAEIEEIDHVELAIQHLEEREDIKTIVIDSLSSLMHLYEAQKIMAVPMTSRGEAWQVYPQWVVRFITKVLRGSSKNIICTSHVSPLYEDSEKTKLIDFKMPLKGQLGRAGTPGIEGYFDIILTAWKYKVPDILKEFKQRGILPQTEKVNNKTVLTDTFTLSSREMATQVKYVLQTEVCSKTLLYKTRSPMGLWGEDEPFVDSNAQIIIDKVREYYGLD